MPGAIAFDSKEFRRGRIAEFFTPLGVSVEIPDTKRFREDYEDIVSSFKEKHSIRGEKNCCPSFDLLKHFTKEKSVNPMTELVNEFDGLVDRVTFYYVIIPKKLGDIKTYGKSIAEDMPRDEFLKRINPAFVHSCLWKFISTYPDDESEYHLDHFGFDTTGGWMEIQDNVRINVYFRGDECNPLISFADLVAGTTDLLFEKNFWRFDRVDPEMIFENCSFDINLQSLTVPDLHYITPLLRKPIDLSPKIKHPIVFFVNEKRPELLNDVGGKDFAKKFLFQNPVWHRTLNLAYELDGCAKLLDPSEDLSYISNGDVLIYTGKKGKETAKFFEGYCPEIQVKKAKELFTKDENSKI
jgi:hypothetical protein